MLGWCEERQPKDPTFTGLAINRHSLTHMYLSTLANSHYVKFLEKLSISYP